MMNQKEISNRIDEYIAHAKPFAQPILTRLRAAIHSLNIGIEEDWKWSAPCYQYRGLVCMTWSFSKHAAIHFFKGALLSDEYKILRESEGGNVSSRFVKFTSAEEMDLEILKAYIREAALLNEQGIKVDIVKKRKPVVVPGYFLQAIGKNAKAKRGFEQMPPSHKREYVEYVMDAKKEETRLRRMAKAIEMMEKKSGLNSRYKKNK